MNMSLSEIQKVLHDNVGRHVVIQYKSSSDWMLNEWCNTRISGLLLTVSASASIILLEYVHGSIWPKRIDSKTTRVFLTIQYFAFVQPGLSYFEFDDLDPHAEL